MANLPTNAQVHGYSLIGIVFVCFCLNFSAFAQATLSSQNKKALKLYEKGQEKSRERDFLGAIELFRKAGKQDAGFYETYLRIGSLFNAMGMSDSVYLNFERYLELAPSPNTSVLNKMTEMSFDRGNYDQSTGYLERLLQLKPELSGDRQIDLIQRSLAFATKEIQNEVEVAITPLPPQVNRFRLQYLPSITIDNSTLVYTKRDAIEGDEDIVVSYYRDNQWTEAQSISPSINSRLNEGACTITADGKVMIFTSCDKRDSFGSCDMYITRKVGASWTRPKNLGRSINTRYWESQPSLSADGKTLYFSSNRPGGLGGRDIWVSSYEDGKWIKPVNLGSPVNTFKDETTPFIHPNGETIYFSSNGHVSMGGFDLIKAEKVDTTWSTVQNLGYPINTFNDEVALLIGGDGETAYFAKEIQKDLRIIDSKLVSFKLPKEQRAKPATYMIGKVVDDKTGESLKASIEVIDLDRTELLFDGESDSISGNYLMVLPSDKDLACYVKKRGYLFFETNFYTESNSMIAPDTLEIRLKPIAINESLVLKNIYFDVDSYELNVRSASELANVIQVLRENPTITVEISGHTDSSGSTTYNQQLSEDRAKAVYEYLLRSEVEESRLEYKGYGDSTPIATNETEEGKQANRRIEFRILKVD